VVNLIGSVSMAIVMVGSDLRIRRFTPMAEKTLNLIPADLGRPITDIKLPLTIDDLEPLVAEVIDTSASRSRRSRTGRGAGIPSVSEPTRPSTTRSTARCWCWSTWTC
jgi:two-component system, chemotaxis family, CheB/CheR fusion protein